jgi:hypothetical protein
MSDGPEESVDVPEPLTGRAAVHSIHAVELGNVGGKSVAWSDNSEAAASPEAALQAAAARVASAFGSILEEHPITLGPYPGREIEIRTTTQTVVIRLYQVGGRLFQLYAERSDGHPVEAAAFFSSFTLNFW